jgi:hypothetical protein
MRPGVWPAERPMTDRGQNGTARLSATAPSSATTAQPRARTAFTLPKGSSLHCRRGGHPEEFNDLLRQINREQKGLSNGGQSPARQGRGVPFPAQ